MLTQLKQKNYSFINSDEWKKKFKKKNIIILRHDIDFDLNAALKIAKIEYNRRIKSNFFFLINSNYYNIYSQNSQDIIIEILNLGHNIGIHIDPVRYKSKSNIKIKNDIKYFEKFYNLKINSFSYHMPSINDFTKIKIRTKFNSYDKKLFKKFNYISDSSLQFNNKNFQFLIKNQLPIHLLTHPIWWVTKHNNIKNKINEIIKSKNRNIIKNFKEYLEILKKNSKKKRNFNFKKFAKF